MPGADEAFGQAWLEAGEVESATALGELVGIVADHLDEGRSQGGAAPEPQHDDGRAGLARVGQASLQGAGARIKQAAVNVEDRDVIAGQGGRGRVLLVPPVSTWDQLDDGEIHGLLVELQQ